MAPATEDVENGAPAAERQRSIAFQNEEPLEEFTALNRYISTYSRYASSTHSREASEHGEGETGKKRHWYTPWRPKSAQGEEEFTVPDDWLRTDPKQGLAGPDIEKRRKKTGWNELTAEKENLIIKFLLYFTGPILYGTYSLKYVPVVWSVKLTMVKS